MIIATRKGKRVDAKCPYCAEVIGVYVYADEASPEKLRKVRAQVDSCMKDHVNIAHHLGYA